MKLALVALPWLDFGRPVAAFAALRAFVQRELPDVQVEEHFAYVEFAKRIGWPLYRYVGSNAYTLGELFFAPFVFPEKKADAHAFAVASFEHLDQVFSVQPGQNTLPLIMYNGFPTWAKTIELLHRIFDRIMEETAERLATSGADVVGFSISVAQLFSSLTLAQRIKRRNPDIKILFGGPTVSVEVGPSILKYFPFVDLIVQGEGERPLVALLSALKDGRSVDDIKGVLTHQNYSGMPRGAELWEVDQMDDLPLPIFDKYVDLARANTIDWRMYLEGSRGCWWDRTKRTGNMKKACYFCNLNIQWSGYREKSIDRTVDETIQLVRKYGNNNVFFADNIIRHTGVEEFAIKLRDAGERLDMFYELRANVTPYQLMLLWEAGLKSSQFGIEGLSTSYLRRIGKGTNVAQNLQAMKSSLEFNVSHGGNLITHFPGATQEEVEETLEVIQRYGMAFEPTRPSEFTLTIGNTIDRLRAEFPVTNIRNRENYRVCVPDDVFEGFRFFEASFDYVGQVADWLPVFTKINEWVALYDAHQAAGSKPLFYRKIPDGIEIFRDFGGGASRYQLTGLEAEIHLWLMQLRKRDALHEAFGDAMPREDLDALVARWIEQDLVYTEGSFLLAVTPAETPELAAERIRNLQAEEDAARRQRKGDGATREIAAGAEAGHG